MIIEIDGYFHQLLLTGKKCTIPQLKKMYIEANEWPIEITDFPDVFCRLYKFEQIPYDKNLKVDFVIDTDTGRIYVPAY
ncbi:hypothetical protein FZC78_10310 [Rossellomorea vietnamensis]|uniref:Uncharacterized protein n=1 Tax=Rossellomorea vietnamensis TaxID=218284 RepID=A0A5D4NT94_9BACI|nr:hypothetical protein FZC78_10310 [Rossellomorea vietnamensis]